ncbi:short chain dehydrogenase [Posidoniimonas corsicana]|uniref:Short chain dehydrogenase n=1 Tax=Posidoniimonas corsicana TaxID=1938618 RepID=A0A5C5VCB1_9BACT|nr:class II aldolase/adducin family protein [Posidoniimonas corsicana]TWT35362.1 short chain dehydrogenase [Posidoniimonas corsicana]
MDHQETLEAILELSHFIGEEHRQLAILGEGNTSAKLNDHTFLVKASGSCLQTLSEEDVVACQFSSLLPMLDADGLSDQEIEERLLASRVDAAAKKPSVETLFHAFLLSLPGIEFAGHAHSVAVNQILCSPMAGEFAAKSLFPDQIVCCGASSVLVPYTDPGVVLARAIRDQTSRFMQRNGAPPRVILLQNHGLITLGRTAGAVKAAMLMAEKAASIFVGAAALGGPTYLSEENVSRIANRMDEHYRQRALKL